jgi:uncharacterized protein GlcG (DUF336 family)
MSEKYWGKVYPVSHFLFNFQAEVYENEKLDDTISIAKQISTKKFFTAFRAKTWIEKTIVNKQKSLIIRDYEILGGKVG